MVFFCIRLAIQHRSFISPAGISGYFKTYLLHVKSAGFSICNFAEKPVSKAKAKENSKYPVE